MICRRGRRWCTEAKFRLAEIISQYSGLLKKFLSNNKLCCSRIEHVTPPQKGSHMKTLIAITLLLLVTCALRWSGEVLAQQAKPDQSADTHQLSSADEKAIRQIMMDQETAWNEHDMNAYMSSYRDDADAINIVGMYWHGKAAILKHLSDFHATSFKDLEETLDEVNVHSIGDGYAIAILIWKVGAFTSPRGDVIPAGRHRSTQVLAKGADGWKVVHFHNTTIDEAAVKGAVAAPKN
jgi:uncharacterized protein (TIGR02246 family)